MSTIDHESLRECLQGANLILCDPPWRFGRDASSNGFQKNASARCHYAALKVDELIAMGIGEYCADDCILLLWSTSQHLPQALQIIHGWGFKYRCIFQTWVKVGKNGKPSTGLGLYSRSSTEFLLLGIRGRVSRLLSPIAKDVSGVIFAPRTRHSEKPAEARLRIEKRFRPCRRKVELFARQRAPGWISWGDQLGDASGDSSGDPTGDSSSDSEESRSDSE